MNNMLSGEAIPDTLGLEVTTIVKLEFGIVTQSDAEKIAIKLPAVALMCV